MESDLFETILKSPSILNLSHLFRNKETLLLENLWNSPKAFIATLASKSTGKNILILTGSSQEEVRLYTDFKCFSDRPIVDFPAWETVPSENVPPSPDIVGDRYQTLYEIKASGQPHIIISSLQACLQKLLPIEKFHELYLQIKIGETHSFQPLIEKLVAMGYQRKTLASDKGEFAVRGGIVDIFPVSSPDPFRIEFWGDEVESIRTFDPIGQKSIAKVDEIKILPAQEFELIQKEQKLATILDYLGAETILIFDDLLALEDRYASLKELSAVGPYFLSIEQFLNQTTAFQKLFLSQHSIEELSEIKVPSKSKGFYSQAAAPLPLQFELFNRPLEALKVPNPFKTLQERLFPDLSEEEGVSGEELLQAVNTLPKEQTQLTFLCETEAEEGKLQRHIGELHLTLPQHTSYQIGYLSTGFAIPDIEMVVFPMTELTKRYKIRRQKQRSTFHTPYADIHQLSPGDLVVHFNHGIGKFLGIEKQPNNQGVLSEYFLVEYAENGKLYVPMQQSYLVNKYIGGEEEKPKLHQLGSNRWKKTRDQTQAAILGYASELLKIYAAREIRGGFTFRSDSPDMQSFEEDFPYIETEDQLAAIDTIKEDMMSAKPMDRLICGDVGYGKTEVAMRAAFKAVIDGGKQVAVLVPTTVLAMQHYENFLERMENFPVNIAVLSRFRTQKEITESLKGIAEGSIDIVIGTHRIISQDVKFKDLGLVIIDEEQRFGVRAKEHLKKIKEGVDCLTLSATPIPRTLYMSLVGARDLSIINSPPQDRLPIKTIMGEPNLQLIKNAILRELNRDGQVFFIHNRVETIFERANQIKEMLPQAKVVVGHGQMNADELDLVFHAFKRGDADILVATSIIENGIDIPNANTILIDRADRFGLAELYQLRGRVGRWNRRAYAYFLVPSIASLPELSRKRLQALLESSGFGAGMKIAMSDLQLRGAGEILGEEQSGHISSLGFDLYCKMLKRTILTLQGKLPNTLTDVKIDLPVDARIPEEYIQERSLRMEIYQRLGEVVSWDELDEIGKEVIDRFGNPPLAFEWLFQVTRLKVFAQLRRFTTLQLSKHSLQAEKQKGTGTMAKSFLFPSLKKPVEISERLIPTLIKEFGIKEVSP